MDKGEACYLGIALAFYHAPWGRNLFVTLFMLPIFVAPVVTVTVVLRSPRSG